MRRPAAAWVVLGAAIAGIAISGYLTASHYQHLPLACTTNGFIDCGAVTSSSFSELLGVPVALLGVGWFAVSGLLAWLGLSRPESAAGRWLPVAWGTAGLVFVLYLVYAELVVIHRVCEWCTALHFLVAFSLLAAVARLGAQPR